MTARALHHAETRLARIVAAINDLAAGRSNAVGTLTLAANAGSTTVQAVNVGAETRVALTPRTANAAAELAAGTLYVSAVARGSFTVTHANNAQTDRRFDYVFSG